MAKPDAWTWLRETQGIASLVDVGAHDGEFGAFLARFFGVRAVVAFEPLPDCAARLRERASELPGLVVHQVALSDTDGEATFWRNTYGPSSSLLRVGELHKRTFPGTDGEHALTVPVRRLDDLVDAEALPAEILVKIDVQGVEDRVLRGGRRLLQRARCVLVEMSFEELYEGQPLFEEVHAELARLGFRFKGIKNQIGSELTGQPLFAHCFYLRPPSPA